MTEQENIYVKLARNTIEKYLQQEEMIISEESLPEELKYQAAAFVSIKKNGQLRGCIGTILPTEDSLAEEICSNAISAAIRDPRFPPVKEEELSELEISVDVLEEPEAIDTVDDLDPHQYGVIVEKGFHRGLLLPKLEGIDTVEEQLKIAFRKAGLRLDNVTEGVQLYRFKVTRHK